MGRPLIPIFFLVVVGLFGIVDCYKWVPLKSGSPLPKNIIQFGNFNPEIKYVGRAKHFDDILPAEVDENGTARISACGEEILKDEYEILTTSDDCEWLPDSEELRQEIILHVGTNNWNNEPIYVGVFEESYSDVHHIASIYGNNRRYDRRFWNRSLQKLYLDGKWTILSCNFKTDWVEATATQLPINKVFSGIGKDGYNTYVARLRKDCDKVIGQVIPDKSIAKALLSDGNTMQAFHVDVLIDEANKYAWIEGSKGTIPDYPIVEAHGYVAIVNKTVVGLTRRDALEIMNYEILTRNYS